MLTRRCGFTFSAGFPNRPHFLRSVYRSGGYGVVLSGNWKQEGRVAVKVLVSDEKSWMDSCYKEAVSWTAYCPWTV